MPRKSRFTLISFPQPYFALAIALADNAGKQLRQPFDRKGVATSRHRRILSFRHTLATALKNDDLPHFLPRETAQKMLEGLIAHYYQVQLNPNTKQWELIITPQADVSQGFDDILTQLEADSSTATARSKQLDTQLNTTTEAPSAINFLLEEEPKTPILPPRPTRMIREEGDK